jgi:hypothetical protein
MKARLSKRRYNAFHRDAKEDAKRMGSLHGSIEDGDGNVAGFLGERAFVDFFGGERHNTYDYDILYDGWKVDVKTKRRTVDPKGYYEASIADYNTEQDCDMYYFVSINTEDKSVWLCGFMPPSRFYDEATFHEEGDFDPDNGFHYKADCWNLAYKEMLELP